MWGGVFLGGRAGVAGGAEARGRAIEECVPRHMRGVLDGSAGITRERRNVDALDVDRQLEPGAEVAAELRVRIGIGAAKLMVQMRRPDDPEASCVSDVAKRVQQRDRVGPARQRDSDTAAGRKQSVTADSAADGVDHFHRCVRCDGGVRCEGCVECEGCDRGVRCGAARHQEGRTPCAG